MMKYADLVMKFLSVLVVPLIGWGVHLQTSVVVLETKTTQQAFELSKAMLFQDRITKMETQIPQLHADVMTALGFQSVLIQNGTTIAKLEERLNAIIENLNDIKDLLRHPVPSSGK